MWSEEERQFLIKNHHKYTYQELAEKLNKTLNAIKHQKQRLGLTNGSLQTNIGGIEMPRYKNVKKFQEEYLGQDKLVGRPIRLNQVELQPIAGKDYAELIFWGDVHLGHPQCQIEKAIENLEYAKKRGAYILIMGDLLESGLRSSVGDSVYQQKLNPQEQMEQMIEILEPYKEIIIGMLTGNHEVRITKETGIDITKVMARILGVKYLGYSCWNLLKVGKVKYSLYSTHGSGGSRFKHTKLKKAMDLAHWIDADIIAYAHQHSIAAETIIKQLSLIHI